MKTAVISSWAKRPRHARFKRLAAVIAFFCAIAACQIGFAGPAFAAEAFQPQSDYIWEVRGGNSRVYLMGSLHLVWPDYALSQTAAELLNSCDAAAVESDTENEATLEAVFGMYTYPQGDNLFAHLSKRGGEHVARLGELYGVKPWDLARFKPFAASSVFSELAARAMGFSFDGVDDLVQAEAMAMGMPILELENGVTIYERFTSLDDDTLERKCILPVYGPGETGFGLMAMYIRYIEGDADALKAFLEGGGADAQTIGGDGLPIRFEAKDALYDQYLMDERNRAWIGVIESWLQTPDRDVFVVAGVSHFLGDGSVVELLEDRGYAVERVENKQLSEAA